MDETATLDVISREKTPKEPIDQYFDAILLFQPFFSNRAQNKLHDLVKQPSAGHIDQN